MARVQVESVIKRFDTDSLRGGGSRRGTLALSDVSLQIRDGETMSLVGSSGCGKSTLLKVIAGLEQADSGQVCYDGQDVTSVRPQDRGVGMVFQDYALYPTMKGSGNLAYYFQVHKRSDQEADLRARETAEVMGVGFDELLGRTSDTLSGGEQQRLAIARCIVRQPTLFLMDEPICNLDAKLRERTRIEIKRLLRKFAVTTIYVTHDQQEAIFLGDRIAVMRGGNIEQVGTFDELYYTPANLYVATFIGSPPLTVLPAVVKEGAVQIGATRWPLPPSVLNHVPAEPIRLGVRPEDWTLDAAPGVGITVRHIERIPPERVAYIHGELNGVRITVSAPVDFPERAEIMVAPNLDRAYFFASTDEKPIHLPGPIDLFS